MFTTLIILLIGGIFVYTYEKCVYNRTEGYELTCIKGLFFSYHWQVKDVKIEASYEGLPVISIGDEAFSNENIEAITIPASIINIGNSSFANCDKLRKIDTYYPEIKENTIDVLYINKNAFTDVVH